jgi:hypothetical protein
MAGRPVFSERVPEFLANTRVFENHDVIIEAGCKAWNKLVDQPETIMSIGMREWAITGQ